MSKKYNPLIAKLDLVFLGFSFSEIILPFLISANSLEEARASVRISAEDYVGRVNGTIVSII